MTYIILIGQVPLSFFFFFSAAKGAGMVGKAGKFMLDMGVTTKKAVVGGALLTGTQSINEQLTLFLRKYREREGKCNELRGLLNNLKLKIEANKVKRDKTWPAQIDKLKVRS